MRTSELGMALAAALLWVGASSVWAQSGLGLYGSGYHGKFSFEDEGDVGDVLRDFTGPGAGVRIEKPINESLSLVFEPNAILKGQKLEYIFDGTGESSRSEETFWLSYAEMPVLATLGVGGGSARPYLLGGASFGFLAVARDKETDTTKYDDGSEVVREYDDSVTPDFNRFEVSLVVGAGVTTGKLFVEVLYLKGLTNIAKDSDDSVTNTGFRLNLGFLVK